MPDPAIELDRLSLSFGPQPLLQDISLSVNSGAFQLITGPSGCGKSTLLHCIAGLTIPESGTIRIFGEEMNAHSVWRLRRHIALVAQEPDLGRGTAQDVLERPFSYLANHPLRDQIRHIPAWMDRLNLPHSLLRKEVATLSGGEKQRLALLSALLLHRPILLLDEATSALDPRNRENLADILRDIQNLTLVSVSHDPQWPAGKSHTLSLEIHT